MGKKAKKQQAQAMREMNQLSQEQFEYQKEQRDIAQKRVDEQRKEFEAFKFTNPFEGMENPFEDFTVDLQAARFREEQAAQSRANILQQLQASAGSSGIAALAQALANQQSIQSQQISANIAQQERQNQMMAAKGASLVDLQQRQGDAMVQQAEASRESTLLGVELAGLTGASAGEQRAMANQMSSMGMTANMYGQQAAQSAQMFGTVLGTIGAVAGAYIMGPMAAKAAVTVPPSDIRLKKNINKIGKSPSGLNIYSFEYKDDKYGKGLFQGVMSYEVPKEAVTVVDGYDRVDYSLLDVEFKQI
tara:strand:- start:2604 stop:3515 length:912 start_codon:yes stop_codon:yes gene_type:complete